jgi:hypothetical protein
MNVAVIFAIITERSRLMRVLLSPTGMIVWVVVPLLLFGCLSVVDDRSSCAAATTLDWTALQSRGRFFSLYYLVLTNVCVCVFFGGIILM